MITNVLGTIKYLGHSRDDDFIDRLHYFLTSNVLIALAVLVSWKQFGGKPVECMVPDMFPSAWEQYAENYCWAQDTYIVSFEEDLPKGEDRYVPERRISYYQWVPFFLLIQASCFRLPSLFWKYFASHSGIKIHDIVKLAVDQRNVEPAVKLTNLKSLTVHLQNALRFHRRLYRRHITPHKILRFLNLPYSAFYVTFVYLFTKLLYLVNVVVQLVLLNRFLETDHYSWYGFGAIFDVMNGTTWEQSRVFPRVTMCDFKVRMMGNVQGYTVQCVLVINIFNEKIFIFLWFWYLFLMVLTLMSFTYWFFINLLPWPSRWFISRHLELSEMPFDPTGSEKEVERFVASYLKADGVFILRMITMHSGIIFGTELVLSLWRSFYGIEEKIRRSDSEETPKVPQTADENKLNIMRARFDKKLKKMRDDNDDDDKSHELKEVLIHSDKLPNDLFYRKPHPIVSSLKKAPLPSPLDMPDSKSTTLEMSKKQKDHDSDDDNEEDSDKHSRRPTLKLIMPDRG